MQRLRSLRTFLSLLPPFRPPMSISSLFPMWQRSCLDKLQPFPSILNPEFWEGISQNIQTGTLSIQSRTPKALLDSKGDSSWSTQRMCSSSTWQVEDTLKAPPVDTRVNSHTMPYPHAAVGGTRPWARTVSSAVKKRGEQYPRGSRIICWFLSRLSHRSHQQESSGSWVAAGASMSSSTLPALQNSALPLVPKSGLAIFIIKGELEKNTH